MLLYGKAAVETDARMKVDIYESDFCCMPIIPVSLICIAVFLGLGDGSSGRCKGQCGVVCIETSGGGRGDLRSIRVSVGTPPMPFATAVPRFPL